jgi:hypothetical protein
MKNKQFLIGLLLFIGASMSMVSCKKNSSTEINPATQQNLSLYLTDGPGLFNNVFIDIRSVKVLVDTSSNTRRHDGEDWDRRGADDQKKDTSFVWENLNIKPGVYDILKFRNGADTLLAAQGITKGSIRLIKIEIGTANSIVKDSVTYPVNLPTNVPNYILIKLEGSECEEYLPGKNRLWLDFDITRSIVLESNGKYYLRAVFHYFATGKSGSIAGKVGPMEAAPLVVAFNGTDTSYAIPDKEGYFKIRGLKDGNYTVYINASNGYFGKVLNGQQVKAPAETSVGTIILQK